MVPNSGIFSRNLDINEEFSNRNGHSQSILLSIIRAAISSRYAKYKVRDVHFNGFINFDEGSAKSLIPINIDCI